MAIEIKMPALGESVTEVTLSRWFKQKGDYVELDEIIAELESDKATVELAAEQAGVLNMQIPEGETVAVGTIICMIDEQQNKPAIKVEEKVSVSSTTQIPNQALETNPSMLTATYANAHPSPASAKILAEKGIAAQTLTGSGKDGRILKSDAMQAGDSKVNPFPPASTTLQEPVPTETRSTRREKMSRFRLKVAKNLVAVKSETAMLTTFNEVDMSKVMDMRAKHKEQFKEKFHVGLGFMSFFSKACCQALQEFETLNARIDKEDLVYHDYIDISIAVSAPKGLVVPVIRNADNMSFSEIEKAVSELAIKARENKLSIAEMTGGTFTITNGGVFGSMMSTPIINPPQSAILGMHNIIERPIAVNGGVVIRPMMYLALSYDHRIIDGRESVGFLVRVKKLLEDPSSWLLGL